MANYALVDGGVVSNIIVADATFAASIAGSHQAVQDVTSLRVMIGDSYSGGLYMSALATSMALTTGDKLSLGMNASSTLGSVSYQWKKNGSLIGGATSATYVITSAATGDSGSYTCTVTDGTNTSTSAACAVTVS